MKKYSIDIIEEKKFHRKNEHRHSLETPKMS